MTLHSTLIERDIKHIWHPCAQMKDYEIFKPIEIVSAYGSTLETREGKHIIDGISSWWSKSLGHGHPRLRAALLRQMNQFEHVMLAHTTNQTIVALSEKLSQLTTSLNKVLYASDGSCAVEMAMKMSVHARKLEGNDRKKRFVALANGYHGETVGALSVSDIGLYRAPYTAMMFDVCFISPLPYLDSNQHPLWLDCHAHWETVVAKLDEMAADITAVIVEPIVQAAGGMRLYSQDFLKRLSAWTKENHIHLIADEIMTGIGRTGKMLACQHANIEPDFLCLSKGLTSGCLPLSATLTHQKMYDLFYDDYDSGKAFLHSHTHSGNTLAASVALEVLNIMEEENICEKASKMGVLLHQYMNDIALNTNKITNVRGIGAWIAADLVCHEENRRIGFEFYRKAVELGALLRPLGKTIYWLPPLTIDKETLLKLKTITEETLASLG